MASSGDVHVLLAHVAGVEHEVQPDGILLRQRDAEVHERVKDHRHRVTLGAHKQRLDLALEPVHNHAVVAHLVALPALGGPHFVWLTSVVRVLDVRLLFDAVEVLVDAVKQEAQKLLRVVLLVASKLRGKLRNAGLELSR